MILISLPINKFLDLSKLKAFADNISNVATMIISVFYWVENTVGKEDADYQHFLLYLQYFQKLSLSGLLEVEIVQ